MRDGSLLSIDSAPARLAATDTSLVIGMQGRLVIDRDLFAGFYVAQRDEKNVIVEDLHESVWTT